MIEELRKEQLKMERRAQGWLTIQNGIETNHSRVEFRRAGSCRYNLFDRQFGNEKAVDTKLAVDLLELRGIYDIAVVFSGDQDYVPAVNVIKNSGKFVWNVVLKTRNGRLLPGGAWRLNKACDHTLEITYDELNTFLNI